MLSSTWLSSALAQLTLNPILFSSAHAQLSPARFTCGSAHAQLNLVQLSSRSAQPSSVHAWLSSHSTRSRPAQLTLSSRSAQPSSVHMWLSSRSARSCRILPSWSSTVHERHLLALRNYAASRTGTAGNGTGTARAGHFLSEAVKKRAGSERRSNQGKLVNVKQMHFVSFYSTICCASIF